MRAYAASLAADANEALFFIHSALLSAFCGPALSPAPCEATLKADIDRHAVRIREARL